MLFLSLFPTQTQTHAHTPNKILPWLLSKPYIHTFKPQHSSLFCCGWNSSPRIEKISYPAQTKFRRKNIIYIETIKFKNLQTINKLLEFIASPVEHNIDSICVQEHRYYQWELELKCYDNGNGWTFVTSSRGEINQCFYGRWSNASQSTCLKIT